MLLGCWLRLVWLARPARCAFPPSLPQLQPAAASPAFLLLQSWSAPPELAPVQDYVNAVSARQSWGGTQAPVEDIVDHWCAHPCTCGHAIFKSGPTLLALSGAQQRAIAHAQGCSRQPPGWYQQEGFESLACWCLFLSHPGVCSDRACLQSQ